MNNPPEIDKGDYLTFASMGLAMNMKYPVNQCEIAPGVWRRHPDLQDHESRSDISRDGYIGVIFLMMQVSKKQRVRRIGDIISAGWKRGWTMGDRGLFDYVNIWPLIPYLYAARYGKWIPTPPVLIIGKAKTGFRAHLAAMIILIDILIGKKYTKHASAIQKLYENSPKNNFFRALARKPLLGTETYDWGGCSPELHARLARFAKEIVEW